MRNQILVALLGMATMLAGCSQEDNTIAPSRSKMASFTIAVDDAVTRAVTEPTDKPTRYIMEVYEGTTSKNAAQPEQVEQTGNTFDVVLKDGQDYTILFWADYGTAKGTDNVFDASKLREVKIATGKVATQAAFAGVVQFKVGKDDAVKYTAVTLKHAVAQVNFKQTGTLTATPTKLTVGYPESYSLNVEDNAATKIDGAVTHELTCNAVTTGTIATDYIIAGDTDDATVMNIEATLNGETKKEISNTPFRRNYATNISGAYSDKYSATLTASCEADWSSSDYNEEITEPVEYAVSDLYPNADSPIGVVLEISDNGIHGKIISRDETKGTWEEVQEWAKNKKDGGRTWTCATKEELQHLWCVFNGKPLSTWEQEEYDKFPTADEDKQAEFNSKLDTPIKKDAYYWSSTQGPVRDSDNKQGVWALEFESGSLLNALPGGNGDNFYARGISAF